MTSASPANTVDTSMDKSQDYGRWGKQASNAAANAYWRSIAIFNLYRITIACIFVTSHYALRGHGWLDNYNSALYLNFSAAYLAFGILAAAFTQLRWPQFNRQVSLQIITDIGFIVVLMFAAGGIKSGLGLLLVIAIAAASMISNGRLALFYASVATIALLLEQSYQLISWNEHYDDYTHAVMLCLSCFATAWLAHSFAKRSYLSETLASQRGVDLASLAQINALITQEMQDGVLVIDSEFKLRHHNQQAEELLGIDGADLQDKTLVDCAPELAKLMQAWMDESEADAQISTLSHISKLAGTEKELKLRFMPISDDRKLGAVIFIEDWSQMQAQAQQLKLMALGQLTANIAHEIRNPLSAISHATQLLQEEETREPSSLRMLQIIADNVQRMDQMVKDILELNRRDRTRQESIDLSSFLTDFHEQFCQIESIPAAYFHLKLDKTPIQIMFDHRHLHQILWNLCRNGWRHSRQIEGSLTLSLRSNSRSPNSRNRSAIIEIMDDGAGISEEVQSHIFEPFFTTESTGTGLGLYIARELCEANSATIKYALRNPGSIFSIQVKKMQALKA